MVSDEQAKEFDSVRSNLNNSSRTNPVEPKSSQKNIKVQQLASLYSRGFLFLISTNLSIFSFFIAQLEI